MKQTAQRLGDGSFRQIVDKVVQSHQKLMDTPNVPKDEHNGIFTRYCNPVLTRDHVPLHWRFDFNEETNPFFQERMGVNSVFNSGAIELDGRIHLVARIEGNDRKSFFAIASSESGVDKFVFRDRPIYIPALNDEETNHYDMRLTQHEDGYIYGLFCTEQHDPNRPDDLSAAVASCGVVRTKDLERWERLPNVQSRSQQRNVVLHPEFVDGKYGLYTRPSDGFIEIGSGGGIGWALVDSMERAVITEETIIDPRLYHTIKESKNGQGGVPIKTKEGWLHVPHGVRGHACGLRYVLYAFLTDLNDVTKVLYRPGGHLLAGQDGERFGDTFGNIFSNGLVLRENGDVLLYYGGADTRLYVVKSTAEQLLDYVKNTPPDGLTSPRCVQQRLALIEQNERYRKVWEQPC